MFWETFGKIILGLMLGLVLGGMAQSRIEHQAVESGVLIYENKAYCVTLMGGYE